MDEAEVYLEIADDALIASEAALQVGAHSKGAFLGYHAFESIGGAYCRRRGTHYPLGHDPKLRAFVHTARHEAYARHAANLAMTYKSIRRNALLYPEVLPGGGVKRPREVISAAQAARLKGRTLSLVNRIRGDI